MIVARLTLQYPACIDIAPGLQAAGLGKASAYSRQRTVATGGCNVAELVTRGAMLVLQQLLFVLMPVVILWSMLGGGPVRDTCSAISLLALCGAVSGVAFAIVAVPFIAFSAVDLFLYVASVVRPAPLPCAVLMGGRQALIGRHLTPGQANAAAVVIAMAIVPAVVFAFVCIVLASALYPLSQPCIAAASVQLPYYEQSAGSKSDLVVVLVVHPICSWVASQVRGWAAMQTPAPVPRR